MGSGIPKPTESAEAVGGDSESPGKDGSACAGPGSNVQAGGAVGIILWKIELVGYQGDAQGPEGVPPWSSITDYREDGETWCRQREGVSSGRGVDGLSRAPPHRSIH